MATVSLRESDRMGQVGAPLRGATSCYANEEAMVRRPSGGGPERPLRGLCFRGAGLRPGQLGHRQAA
eukprot:12166203-Alexandrium_andersonii.AAC.1